MLPRSFFDRPSLVVARELLGAVVVRGDVAVRLTEVEAYTGPSDPASHAYRGRTRRNAVMFGPPGHAYVYFTYGMHWCVNLVCGPRDEPAAVLLRAGAVVDGLATARSRGRGRRDPVLARGPACLTQVLDITGDLDGSDVTAADGPLSVHAGRPAPEHAVAQGPRVGVRGAEDRPWRFWWVGEPSVSRARSRQPVPDQDIREK